MYIRQRLIIFGLKMIFNYGQKIEIYIYIYIYIYYLKKSTNISSTTRPLKFSYISILTNLLQTDNETKSVKAIYN